MDNLSNLDFLSTQEKLVLRLRALYTSYGYKKQRPSRFESYDFYRKNKDFLVGNKILTFTDLNGKLMALKPDITLSIIKNADSLDSTSKVYYTENVYRESKDVNEFKEIFQVGLEVFGKIDDEMIIEIISLALKSLDEISKDNVLEISDVGYIEGLLDCLTDDEELRDKIRGLISQKNTHDLKKLLEENSLARNPSNVLCKILDSTLSNEQLLEMCEELSLNSKMSERARALKAVYNRLEENDLTDKIKIDFSLTKDPNYYNGIVLQGFINSVPTSVLSGGRYDRLVQKMGKQGQAMGFAIYFDSLERFLTKKTVQTDKKAGDDR